MKPRSAALRTGGLAFGFSLFQVYYRWIGKGNISGTAVAAAVTAGFLYAWWARCLQEVGRGEASALSGLFVFAAGWSLAGNGLAPLVSCRPGCNRYELFVGLGNTVFGAAAVGASWWAMRRESAPNRTRAGLISVALVGAALILKVSA